MDWQSAFIARAKAALSKTYWVNAPQTTTGTYATLLDVTELRPQLLTGWDLESARIQIDVWGVDHIEVRAAMETLLAALVPGNTANGHTFQRGMIVLGPRDIPGEREAGANVFRKSADLAVAHRAV